MKHHLLNEFDEIDSDEEEVDQNDVENHNIVTPNLRAGTISGQNPDVARYVNYLLGILII
jgi:hypothetical protein